MHLLELMRLIYVASVLMMLVMVSAQCQQKSEDWLNKGNALSMQNKYNEAIKAYYEAVQLDSSNSTLKAKVNALREQNESDEIKSETLPLNEDKIPSQIPSLEQGKVTVMFDVSKAQEEAIKKKWEHDNPVVFVTSKASAYDHISNYSLDLGNMYLVLDLTIRNQVFSPSHF